MIVIRTKHDLATEYTYAWTEPIIKDAEKRGFSVTKVEGNDTNFNNFEKRIKKKKPKFVFFNGHGSENSLHDNKGDHLIDLKSSYLLKNTITFARSCNSLLGLGKKAVEEGCNAFIGYKKKFIIPRWHRVTCKPSQDKAAKPIFECSNLVAKELLKGKTVEIAVTRSHQKASDVVVDLIYSKEPFASPTLVALIHNDSALSFVGEESSRIVR